MIRFEDRIKVRYYDCDHMGVMHHSNYLRYFESARDDMMESWGYKLEQCEKDGIFLPVVKAELRNHRPAVSGEMVRITAEIPEVPLAKIHVRQQMFNAKGELCCEAEITLGFLSAATGRPVRCPEKLAALMERLSE